MTRPSTPEPSILPRPIQVMAGQLALDLGEGIAELSILHRSANIDKSTGRTGLDDPDGPSAA